MKKIREKLTYANVVSSLCLFLLLGGGAAFAATKIARNSVGANQLKQNSVTAAKLKNGAVTSGKLGAGAVTNQKLGAGSVSNDKLTTNAVSSSQLTDGAVTSAKLANGSVTDAKLATKYLPAGTSGIPVAAVNVNPSGDVESWLNDAGGAPTVTHTGTGDYLVTFPGQQGKFVASQSIGLVSLFDTSGEVSRGDIEGNPRISTYNSAGTRAGPGIQPRPLHPRRIAPGVSQPGTGTAITSRPSMALKSAGLQV